MDQSGPSLGIRDLQTMNKGWENICNTVSWSDAGKILFFVS